MTNTLLKLIFILYSSLIIILETNLYTLLFFFIIFFILTIYKKIKIPIKYILLLIIPIYILFLIVFSIEYQKIDLFIIYLTFIKASSMILKLLSLIFINLLFITSTSPLKFINALKRVKFPNNIAIAFLILIGIIPNILKTIKQIYEAQLLRGFQKIDLLTTKGWKLFLVPLFIHTFSYSQQITIQIQLKDYSSYRTDEDNINVKSILIFIFMVILFASLSYLF